ncbi:MIT domain-containing protein 1-like isoform X2 [Branchiostoma floridae x Branchiostoma belcheri]
MSRCSWSSELHLYKTCNEQGGFTENPGLSTLPVYLAWLGRQARCQTSTTALRNFQSHRPRRLKTCAIKATTDEAKKEKYRERIGEYMDRAEEIKKHVQLEKEAGKYHEQIHITAGSVGYSYGRLFKPYIDQTLTEVWVDDPYIRSKHQIMNFLRFCELLVKSDCQVRRIHLTTGEEEGTRLEEQKSRLGGLGESLQQYGISLEVQYSHTLHDREIRGSSRLVSVTMTYESVMRQLWTSFTTNISRLPHTGTSHPSFLQQKEMKPYTMYW